MNEKVRTSEHAARFAKLRQRAEAFLREDPDSGVEITLDEARQLIHELDVYRVELEMQNDELVRTQEELLDSRAEYSDLYNHAPVGYLSLDGKGVVQRANATLASMLQLSAGYLLRQPLGVFIARQDKERFYRHYGQFVRAGYWQDIEVRLRRHDGSVFWAQLSANTSAPDGGSETSYRIAVVDVEDARQARERQHRLATAIDRAAEGFCITGADGAIEYMNTAFATFARCDPEQAAGRRVQDVLGLGDTDLRPFQAHPYDGVYLPPEIRLARDDGRERVLKAAVSRVADSRGALTNYVVLLHDITHEHELERRLRQSQKMEAIGTLAGGIAHDLNNMLSPIIGYTQLTLADLDGGPLGENLREVLHAANRATELVQQVLTFSRGTEHEWQVVRVGSIVEECCGLLRGSLPSTIAIDTDLRPTPPVLGDAGNLHQVVMNLCTNAFHAMRERGGVLSITLEPVDVNEDNRARFVSIGPGKYACLTVTDTGCGMDGAVLERIFEPYFTTKSAKEGTGMGLSTVHGIVTQHGGEIAVHSTPGAGTTFRVYLPLAAAAPDAAAPEAAETPDSACQGTERILLVDDEPSIVRLGDIALSMMGYQVTACHSPGEALETFQQKPDAFDVIISDQTMPGMTGLEFARQARAIRPDIVFILCSGFSEAVTDASLQEAGIDAYVRKPVKPRDLAAQVRRSLGERAVRGT